MEGFSERELVKADEMEEWERKEIREFQERERDLMWEKIFQAQKENEV